MANDLRNQLAQVIGDARHVGEIGARQALDGLAVDRRDPHRSMSAGECTLRRRLRAHGRQLGDRYNAKSGIQSIDRLAHKVAFEHWHRMLFARFLAENQLLIEPESGVAVSLADCEDLACERNEDPWALAGRFARRMLPRIFRADDPALEVVLAPETRQALDRLLESLPVAVFTADDSLGWTYQFWQAERKDQVNASGVKIGADELPAVTQLFTERYMVLFLFHNTVGAWRAGKLLAERPELAESASGEEELRHTMRLDAHGGYDFSYLRFVREAREGDEDGQPTGRWRPAAGDFPGWPRTAAELRVLDPCCGSGHFLVEGFALLVRLRMEEERLDLTDAISAVLRYNLHGLEIDPRCTQIAAFNLALAAWKLAGKVIAFPALNVACSGLAPNASKQEWIAMAEQAAAAAGMPAHRDLFGTEDSLLSEPLRGGLGALYDLFEQAPELGSLIDPHSLKLKQGLFQSNFESVRELISEVLDRESADEYITEHAVAAQGMARAAELLVGRYTLVITNVPYLVRGKQSDTLKDFAETHHYAARADLATMFVSRIFIWLGEHGTQAVVAPQNWLFLASYRKLRKKLLKAETWHLLARLGPGAFETIGGEVVKAILFTLSTGHASMRPNGLFAEAATAVTMYGLDVSASRTAAEKAARLADAELSGIEQVRQMENPDASITTEYQNIRSHVGQFAFSYHGITTTDYSRFGRSFWENLRWSSDWVFQQGTTLPSQPFSGKQSVLLWEDGRGGIRQLQDEGAPVVITGLEAWAKCGVVINQMGELTAGLYNGDPFDTNVAILIPSNQELLAPLWAFCSSAEFNATVRKFNQKVVVEYVYYGKLPFDLPHWQQVAAEKYPNGLPEPYSNEPTQWLFHGHPCRSVVWDDETKWTVQGRLRTDAAVLQVAVARLLGYRWPAECDRQMRLAEEQRAWVERCRELDDFADTDGIVCLAALRGEARGAERLRRLLAAAYGSEWSSATERRLLAGAAGGGRPSASLEEWLRDRFFAEHCKLFYHRPFVWHLWDGRKDGFHALVNYHRLTGPDGEGLRTLSKLLYDYLGVWVARQKAEQREGTEGADGRLAAAINFGAQLEMILEGEPPCDLFIRWKPLHRQPIGWEPDRDDGVRLNIRPFIATDLRFGGRKGAGILRAKPNVKWSKDRGKEPASLRPRPDFPWFWGCPGAGTPDERTDFLGGSDFDGNRWNDLHYTNVAKRAARRRAGVPEE